MAEPGISDEELNTLADTLYGPLPAYTAAFCKVKTKGGSLVHFDLNMPQMYLNYRLDQQLSEKGWVRALIPKARQMGVSTYTEARAYRKTTTGEGVKTFILTHEDPATAKLFGVAKTIHDHFPLDLRVAASNDAADALNFRSIGGEFALATAKTKARGRGDTIQFFHGSEVAFWDNAEDHVDGVFQAIADREPGTEVILESTGKGPLGLFYNMVQDSIRGNSDYQTIFLPWTLFEAYVVDEQTAAEMSARGYSQKWAEYAATHGLSPKQLAWAYLKNRGLAAATREDPDEGPCHKFKTEYPIKLSEAFLAGDENALIKANLIHAARNTVLTPESQQHAALVVGLDIARGGKDKTEFMSRRGRLMGEIQVSMNTDDTMRIVGQAQALFQEYPDIDMMFIDTTGVGGPVYDALRNTGYREKVRPVNFGSNALDEKRYPNRRCEIWGRMKEWFEDEGPKQIPDDDTLEAEIGAPTFWHDANTRLVVEGKKEFKKRLKFSPDKGDAAALTFSETVIKPETLQRTTQDRRSFMKKIGRGRRRPPLVG